MLLYILSFFIICFLRINSESNSSCFVRIYSNQAEIIQPLHKLPLEFTEDDWNEIRSDSITLLGQNIDITSQTITEKQQSLNGAEIYVHSPVSIDKTTLNIVKGILIDENTYLVKIKDPLMDYDHPLYFTTSPGQIFYLEQPTSSKFYVNFTYNTVNSNVNVSYLRSSLKWHTQYQLNLQKDDSTLIAMANIRNNGKSPISINQAELIGGDINLRSQELPSTHYFHARAPILDTLMSDDLMIEQENELAGLYVFPINKPFKLDAKTNYLLPMFRPHVTVERYGLISKYFSTESSTGKAQRSYRLTSDRFLTGGNCIIREFDRIVGETTLPDIAANDKHEFSIGQDAEIVYKENVLLISSTKLTDQVTEINRSKLRSHHVYEINIQIINFKTRSITIDYEQKVYHGYENFQLITSNQFIQHGSSIKSNMTLAANDDKTYTYRIKYIA